MRNNSSAVKSLALLLVLILTLSLSACGKKDKHQGEFTDVETSKKEEEQNNPLNTFTELEEPFGLTYKTYELSVAHQKFMLPEDFNVYPATPRHLIIYGSGDFSGVLFNLYMDSPFWASIEADPEWEDVSAMKNWDRFSDDIHATTFSVNGEQYRIKSSIMPSAFDIETGIEDFHTVCGYVYDNLLFLERLSSSPLQGYKMSGIGYNFDHVRACWTAIYPEEKNESVDKLLAYIVSTVKYCAPKKSEYKEVQLDDYILNVPVEAEVSDFFGVPYVFVPIVKTTSPYSGMGFAVYDETILTAYQYSPIFRLATQCDGVMERGLAQKKIQNLDFNGCNVKEAEFVSTVVYGVPSGHAYENGDMIAAWVYHIGNEGKVLVFFDRYQNFDTHYDEIYEKCFTKNFKYLGN